MTDVRFKSTVTKSAAGEGYDAIDFSKSMAKAQLDSQQFIYHQNQ